MANKLDNAEIVPTSIASGAQALVEITYQAEQAGSVLVDFDPHLFTVTPPTLPVPASQAGFVRRNVTITRLTAQKVCVVTFHFFTSDADGVEVT